jgi:O-6-methylguanine DNA methyltransferase
LNRSQQNSLREARQLLRELRALREVQGEYTLLPDVLSTLDLADAYTQLTSPIGPIFVVFNQRGIRSLSRAEDASTFERRFRAQSGRPLYYTNQAPPALLQAVEALLQGHHASLSFDLRDLTPFEQAVLLKALSIPYGEVRPYAWIAREIGRPRAVRAVGSALARNPIPLLIPCHRVVRSDGHIGNYSLGGPHNKRAILQAEGVDVATLEHLASRGVRYIASASGDAYCLPGCRYALRIAPARRVHFRSAQEAVRAGYRPCEHCRPSLDPGQALAADLRPGG